MAEAERKLPFFIMKVENILLQYNIGQEKIIFRVAGCPNGCGRSLLSEIGLIGKSPGRYNLYIGGNHIGTRIATVYSENCTEQEIFDHIEVLIKLWSEKRKYKAIINPENDFWIK
jgi:sulfite reductase (NADPH) hemoprotein beta-component